MNKLLVEASQIVLAQVPVDLQTAGAPGVYVTMKDYGRLSIVVAKGVGTAGDDPVITLLQATSVENSDSAAKALNFYRVDKKQGVQTGIGQFSTSTADAPLNHDVFNANTWSNTDLAENAALIVINVKAEDLDVTNGFCCVKASIADTGSNAQLGCMLYILSEARYEKSPLPDAITD